MQGIGCGVDVNHVFGCWFVLVVYVNLVEVVLMMIGDVVRAW